MGTSWFSSSPLSRDQGLHDGKQVIAFQGELSAGAADRPEEWGRAVPQELRTGRVGELSAGAADRPESKGELSAGAVDRPEVSASSRTKSVKGFGARPAVPQGLAHPSSQAKLRRAKLCGPRVGREEAEGFQGLEPPRGCQRLSWTPGDGLQTGLELGGPLGAEGHRLAGQGEECPQASSGSPDHSYQSAHCAQAHKVVHRQLRSPPAGGQGGLVSHHPGLRPPRSCSLYMGVVTSAPTAPLGWSRAQDTGPRPSYPEPGADWDTGFPTAFTSRAKG